MIRLRIIEGKDTGRTYELKPGQEYLIGREQAACEVCLNDPGVSRVHARLMVDRNGDAVLFDEGSKNGIAVRGKKISQSGNLLNGDRFRLGGTAILFEKQEPAVHPEANSSDGSTSGLTHFLDGGGFYNPQSPSSEILSVRQRTIAIGRDQTNDVVLNHPMVSRFHARMTSKDERYYIHDLNSVNGTFINGVRVEKQAEVKPNSIIQVCGFRFIFDGSHLIEYEDNSGQIRIQVNRLGKTVPSKGGVKQILSNITLEIEPCEFVAILGGSGAGKSTFLNALSGLFPATRGQIFVNGQDFYRHYDTFHTIIGYVPQDDIVHAELTVQEVLYYAARLRMPDDTSDAEIKQAAATVMHTLEIDALANEQVKILSGGQRKRVSIGVELITSPSLFFLDEPTSGLDPGLEKVMMELMRRLAQEGRTVILVTHATFNIRLCDKVVILGSGGQLAFCGTPDQALNYFGVSDFAEIYALLNRGSENPGQWAARFEQSSIRQNQLQMERVSAPGQSAVPDLEKDRGSQTSSWRQWLILTRRYARVLGKDHKNMLLLMLQPLILAFLIAAVFHTSDGLFAKSAYTEEQLAITGQVVAENRLDSVLETQAAETERRSNMSICLAMMVFTAIWLGTSNAAKEIVKESAIYKRERLFNLRIWPYLMSKFAVLVLVSAIQSVIFVSIIYAGLGLPEFAANLGAVYLVTVASIAMGLFVSALASNPDKASSAVPLLLVPQIILSGALIPPSKVSSAVSWLFDLAIAKWGYELVAGQICSINSRAAVEALADLNQDFAGNWYVLGGFVLVFMAAAAVAMKNKDRQKDRGS